MLSHSHDLTAPVSAHRRHLVQGTLLPQACVSLGVDSQGQSIVYLVAAALLKQHWVRAGPVGTVTTPWPPCLLAHAPAHCQSEYECHSIWTTLLVGEHDSCSNFFCCEE